MTPDTSHTGTVQPASKIKILPFLAVVLLALLLLKAANIWTGVSSAGASDLFARDRIVLTPVTETTSTDNSDSDAVPSITASLPQNRQDRPLPEAASAVERRLLERLSERRKYLDERETRLDLREDLLRAAELKLQEQVSDLKAQQVALEALESKRTAAKSEELQALVNAYERMKPRDAARVFEILDNDLLVSVALEMRTQALSGVLAEMVPERARELTQLMAERSNVTNINAEL